MSYWVTAMASSPFAPLPVWMHTGTYSSSGPGAMTTPAACTDACRDSPSSVSE